MILEAQREKSAPDSAAKLRDAAPCRRLAWRYCLHYIYICNISGKANTVCHACVKMLVRCACYHILKNHILP